MDYGFTPVDEIATKMVAARATFDAGTPRPIACRWAWTTDIGLTVSEINHVVTHLKRGGAPREGRHACDVQTRAYRRSCASQ